ncbi:response regulator [bacterium]|jgi:PAS domain S-box-containing protein|nr:response regulator [bacterium]
MKRFSILLIEDNIIDQMAFKRIVKTHGLDLDYQIAGSFAEAKKILDNESFDVIVTDHDLGDGSGFDVLELEREEPIVFVTGGGDEEIAIRAMRDGAFDYLLKDQDLNYLKVLPMTVKNAVRLKSESDLLDMLSHSLMSTKDSVYITNLDGDIQFVNKAFSETYNYAEDDINGKNSRLLWKDECVIDVEGNEWNEHMFHKTQCDKLFPVSISESFILDKKGLKNKKVYVVRDITKLKKAEDELKASQAKILQLEKESTERQMAGGFAHEMRNALAGAKLMLEPLLNDPEHEHKSKMLQNSETLKQLFTLLEPQKERLPMDSILSLIQGIFENEEKLDEVLRLVQKATLRGLDITEQIMNYSEVGKQKIGDKLIDFNLLLQDILKMTDNQIRPNGIIVETNFSKAIPSIVGDESQFESVFKNIILNAKDALIDSSLLIRKVKKIEVSSELLDAHTISVKIRDNGVGIPKKNISRVYDAFFSTKPETGTGLGLGMVKKIVNLYNGELIIDSVENEWTQFDIRFDVNR